MRTKRTRILALLTAVLMICLLAGCEVSSSSTTTTTVTTSKTDADGNTTTNTVTNEVGVSAGTDGISTTNETTTETTTTAADEAEEAGTEDDEEAWEGLAEHLYDTYTTAAEGTNEAGDMFYYAFNENDGEETALIVIVSADGDSYTGWEGTTSVEDDHVVLYSEGLDEEIPFSFSDVDEEGTFTLTFLGDGDEATMQLIDLDSFVEDLVAARRTFA
ncbi:MAG: hypothetical protein K6C12_15420 [Oscillospiraceae bacterium]|nr:hypothetical protein [Oscillospiraceae bacterium]